jgi:tRNA A37 threonylcarbamoyladenosine dehydratase
MRSTTLIAISASTSVAITLAVQSLYRSYLRTKLSGEAKREAENAQPVALSLQGTPSYSEELIAEQLARNIAFLGQEGVEAIRKSYIVIVGAGGVGSWAATMLVRSGVGRIKIIDFDQVTLSSLNRHATATLADVGTPKVNSIAKYLRQVAPWAQIEPIIALWTQERGDLLENATYVLDCIDNIDTKVDLLEYCYIKGIPVISSMGAGCKADPTRVRIADLSMSIEDPLSRATRRRLRLKGITTGIPVVFSSEKPGKVQLLELDEAEFEKGKVDELSVLRDFRVRILPVLGPLPAIFGLTIATHLLTWLGGYDSVYDPIQGGYSLAGKQRTKFYDTAMQSLVGQAARMGWEECRNVPIDLKDVEYLIEEVFRGKSISGQCNRLVLTKWDPNKPLQIGNIVPVNKEQQAKHEKEILKGGKKLEDVYPEEVMDVVEKRLALDEWYQKFR